MKRVPKIRAFDKKSQKWIHYSYSVTGGLLYVRQDGFPGQQDPEIDEDSVGMFTGLKDKDGVEIYEGDIVKCEDLIYKVGYDGQHIASFYLVREGDLYRHYFGEAMEAGECMVIGNVYEHSELLRNL